jgi:hypothetical protein
MIFSKSLICAAKLRFLEGSLRLHPLHIILFLFVAFNSTVSHAQLNSEHTYFNLEFTLTWNGSSWDSEFSNDPLQVREGWKGYEIVRSHTAQPVLVSKYGSYVLELSWENVSEVKIRVKGSQNCPEAIAKLSAFTLLDDCPIQGLHQLTIDYSDFGCRLEADIQNWDWLDETRKTQSLQTFRLIGNHAPIFDINVLEGQPLRTLVISKTLGEEVCQFSTLEQLEMPGIRNAFAHHAACLPSLRVIRDKEGMYFNRFHYEHAERYFWLRSTNALQRPIYSSETFKKVTYLSPMDALIQNVQYNLPEKWTKRGEIYVNEDDLPARTHFKNKGDTLLHGFVKRGKPKGIWTLRIEEQYDFNDFEAFHIDLKANPIVLPSDGAWKLHYTSGNTAISGSFEENKKIGEWKFYNEAGELRAKRSYENDTLKRLVVNFDMRGLPLESRAFYLSENTSIQSFYNGEKVQFIYLDLWVDELDQMVITENSISILIENGSYQIYNRNHTDFETIFRSEVIDKVYPEYIGQKLPFKY